MTSPGTEDLERRRFRRELIDRAISVVSVPRVEPADSFVLHAPLNLMARIGLLDIVPSEAVAGAEAEIESTVKRYEESGRGVGDPPVLTISSPTAASNRLAVAVRAGDLDDVDAVTHWLTTRLSPVEIAGLVGELLIDSLAAAGHAPIGFQLLQRVRGGTLPPSLLRGPMREVARNPDRRIRWFRNTEDRSEVVALDQVLASLPYLGPPSSNFIFELMSQVELDSIGRAILGPLLSETLDVARIGRILTRAAALCMLYGDPAHAPYGWTHAFTMPQGALALADLGVRPRTAVAVAVTFFAGFRIAYDADLTGSLADEAASDYLPADSPTRDEPALAAFAAIHHDEHLVKYTLACIHAAQDDPAWRLVYLRAAGHLADWWRANPDAGFS